MGNAQLFEYSDVYCRSLETMEFYCCPDSTTGSKDPCPFCGDGITIDDSVAVSVATICGNVVEFAKIVEGHVLKCVINTCKQRLSFQGQSLAKVLGS